jgi:hypothetical protein
MAYKFPVADRGYPGLVRFTPVDETDGPAGETIELYLPAGVLFADKMEYENMGLGAAGAAAFSASADGNAVEEQGYLETLKQSGNVAVAELARRMGPGGTGVAAQLRNKTSPNPNTRALFKQVSLRSFQYNFKLIPTSQQEANNIKDIIKEFRTQMYPTLLAGGNEGTSLGYRFPNRYEIEMFYEGERIENAPKTVPAYLEALQVSYNPTGQTMLQEGGGTGTFAETDLNLTFTESRTISQEDVLAGY